MKTKFILTLCLPLLAFAGQNRHGAPVMTSSPSLATNPDCQRNADCPLSQETFATPTTLAAADLGFAIEEERLAHDIYAAAAAKWNLRVFANIAAAELRHATALSQLAASVGVTPPTATTGVYAAADLQHLHDQLLALVNDSEIGALQAGALIEETDIADLRRMAALVSDEGSRAVLANLERASGNHLGAFVRNLATRGVVYQPRVLTPDDLASAGGVTPGGGRGGQAERLGCSSGDCGAGGFRGGR